MKTFAFAGLSLIFALSVQGHAFASDDAAVDQTDETATLATDAEAYAAVATEYNKIAATKTDEEAAALVQSEADETEQDADAAVQDGTLTPEQAQNVQAMTTGARSATTKKGFRKRLLAALKTIGHDTKVVAKDIKHNTKVVAKDIGYAGEAVGVAWITPLYAGAGFTAGVIAGDNKVEHEPARAAFIVGSVAGGVAVEVGATHIAGAILDSSVAFPVTISPLVINHFVVGCNVWKNDGKYCENIANIDAEMTDGALQHSRRGGSKVRGFFVKVFKHKNR